MPHDAFISYSRKDRPFAVRLQKALQRYTPPKDLPVPHRRLDVFRDEEDFTGAEYFQSVERHLGDAAKLIVLCSPAARASTYVDDEIRRFARLKDADNVIALLVAGVPNNEAKSEEQAQMAFPAALCEILQMPLAADYRGFDPQKSKVDRGPFATSWFTTLANLYGVSRAQIEQRELKRRARRRQIIAGAVITSLAVLGLLSFFAWNQRQNAAQQANVAAARFLAGRAIAAESVPPAQGLRIRALLAAASLRRAWTDEGYGAWRRATSRMPPVLASIPTDSLMISLRFSADGRKLIALCGDRHVHVFSVPDLKELQQIEASSWAQDIAIDATGSHVLAYKANDESVEIIKLAGVSKRTVWIDGNFSAAAFDAAGDTIVTSLTNLWVADQTGDSAHSRIKFPKGTLDVALSPDSAVVVARTPTALTAYETTSGAVRWQTRIDSDGSPHEILFSSNAGFLSTGAKDATLIVSAETGSVIRSIPVSDLNGARVIPVDGESYLVGNVFHAQNAPADSIELPLPSKPIPPSKLPVASPTGRYIAGLEGNDTQNFGIVDLSQPFLSLTEPAFYATLEDGLLAKAAAFNADDSLLALSADISGFGRKLGVLQLVSLERPRWQPIVPIRSRTGDFTVLPGDARVLVRGQDNGTGTYASASGRFFARLERGKGWIVTEPAGGRRIMLPDNGSPIEFSPDERRALVFPNIYDLNDPSSPTVVPGGKTVYQTNSFPGSPLVVGKDKENYSDEKESVLFDWRTGKVSPGPGSAHSIYGVSPDGKRIATADYEGIAIWTVGAKAPQVHSDRMTLNYDMTLNFSPDGKLLAVGTCRSTPLYDAGTLRLLFRIPLGSGCFAGFTRDGKFLVSRTWNAGFPEPTFHPLTLAGVIAETCAKVTADLTAHEWQRYSPGVPMEQICPPEIR